ncbi:putative metalloprotease CJM1_0395 family protein [Gammaproteobacteria bacterium AS21]|jgi:hypothetical protein
MELNNSNLNLQINSPVSSSNASELKRAVISSSALSDSSIANALVPKTSSSVLTQLVTGPVASAALYNDFVKLSPADNSVPAQNTVASKVSQNSESSDAELVLAQSKIVQRLAAVDREVKAHEQAHAAIGGVHAGSPTFDYESGPDGQMYAVSGHVSIDTSAVENDPRATLEKAQVIIRAALSVADPSAADRQVASQAKAMALQAMSELGETKVDDESLIAVDQVEKKQLELEEFHAKEELRQARQEKDQALTENRKQTSQASLEVLKEFNAQIHEIQETLRRLNVQLVDTGAFAKAFPQGSLFDQNV